MRRDQYSAYSSTRFRTVTGQSQHSWGSARLGRFPALANAAVTVYVGSRYFRNGTPRKHHMSHARKVAIAAFIAALGATWNAASAHGRLYPLTRCGPDL